MMEDAYETTDGSTVELLKGGLKVHLTFPNGSQRRQSFCKVAGDGRNGECKMA